MLLGGGLGCKALNPKAGNFAMWEHLGSLLAFLNWGGGIVQGVTLDLKP